MKSLLLLFLFATVSYGALPQGGEPSVPSAQRSAAKQAKESFRRGHYREAERTYEAILAAAPDNLYALSNLGVVRFRLKKSNLAAEALERAIAVAPNDSFSHRTLGIVYYYSARYEDAVRALTRAVELDATDAAAHNYLGIIYAQQGRSERAEEELQKAGNSAPAK